VGFGGIRVWRAEHLQHCWTGNVKHCRIVDNKHSWAKHFVSDEYHIFGKHGKQLILVIFDEFPDDVDFLDKFQLGEFFKSDAFYIIFFNKQCRRYVLVYE
jgi:hypothetical protein